MTDDENVPKVVVETSNATIQVTDSMTAEAALPFIEGALKYYLSADDDTRQQVGQANCVPYNANCDKCGYEWEYTGKSPYGTACPQCDGWTGFDERPPQRGES